MIVTSTAFGELPALVSGLRSLGNDTPILNSWAGDGTYWVPKDPQVTNYYARHVRVGVRRRPERGGQAPDRALKQAQAPPGHGRLRHRRGRDRRRRRGDPPGRRLHEGAALAGELEQFKNVAALGGNVNFSPQLHTCSAAQYRVIQDPEQQGASYVGTVTAKVVPKSRA